MASSVFPTPTIVNVGYRSTNFWVVSAGKNRLLVDLGWPGKAAALFANLERMGVPLTEIRYGLATHYHIDHAGAAQNLKLWHSRHLRDERRRLGPAGLTSGIRAVFPAWSPGGSQILFTATVDNRANLYFMNADGTGQRKLTETTTGHSRLAFWSPDGRQIVFNSNRDGNDEIYIMSADGSNARNVSNHQSADLPFGWSADGHILFLSTRDRNARDVYRMKVNGSGVTRITTTK